MVMSSIYEGIGSVLVCTSQLITHKGDATEH